jgi:hypothetical protein
MKPSHTEELIQLLKKGLDHGFSEHHVIEQLERRGYKKNEIDYALLVIKNPHLIEEEQMKVEEENKEEPKQAIHPYDEIIQKKKHDTKRKPFETLKDPATMYLVLALCVLFFILGMTVDKLIKLI